MRAFLVGCLAAIVIAGGAYGILTYGEALKDSASSYFSGTKTRI